MKEVTVILTLDEINTMLEALDVLTNAQGTTEEEDALIVKFSKIYDEGLRGDC